MVKVILTGGRGGCDASLGFVELNRVGVSDVSLHSEELNSRKLNMWEFYEFTSDF